MNSEKINELTLRELTPYLPYGLKVVVCHGEYTMSIDDEMGDLYTISDVIEYQNKPILRQLSYLTQEIDHNGEKFVPIEYMSDMICAQNLGYNDHYIDYDNIGRLKQINWLNEPYFITEKLFEWHFDVFGLIEKGFAVSY